VLNGISAGSGEEWATGITLARIDATLNRKKKNE
jgi:hypothetical protein